MTFLGKSLGRSISLWAVSIPLFRCMHSRLVLLLLLVICVMFNDISRQISKREATEIGRTYVVRQTT